MKKILLLAIFWMLGFALANSVDAEDAWGNLKGKIKVIGELPEIAKEVVNKDIESCLKDGEAPADDNLLVSKDGGLKDAFIMMYLKGEKPEVHPSYAAAMTEPVVLDNKQCRFEPHAFILRTGQPLHLKNSDDVGHNCHAKLFNNEFNVNVPKNDTVEMKMEAKEKIPGLIVCDIHPWMDSVVLVRDEPYAAVSDEEGNFEIKNIPVGEWKFQFWHRKAGYLRDLDVPSYKVGRRGEIKVVIEDGATLDLGEMVIDGKELDK